VHPQWLFGVLFCALQRALFGHFFITLRLPSYLSISTQPSIHPIQPHPKAWSESRMSALEKRVGANNEKTVDGNAWVKGAKEKGGSDKTASSSSTSSSNGGSEKQLVNGGSTASTAATADLLDHSEPDPPPPPPPAPPTVAPAPPPAAAAPQAAPPAAAAPPSVIGGEVVGISQEALPLMKGWFNGLVLAPQGVLFEDAHLQVEFVFLRLCILGHLYKLYTSCIRVSALWQLFAKLKFHSRLYFY